MNVAGAAEAGVVIEAGEIAVSSVVKVLNTDRVIAWEVDLHSKYAEILGYSCAGVLLYATNETMHVYQALRGMPTHIGFTLPNDGWGWSVIADCGRYTCRIVAYLVDDESEEFVL